MAKVQKQIGVKDYGPFAIAFAATLASTVTASQPVFDQEKICSHLISCLEAKYFSKFPQLILIKRYTIMYNSY